MPGEEGIRVCTVCGGSLGPFYLCYHCSGTRPTDPETLLPEWTCSSCSELSPTQFACRNCGTRFLFDEIVQEQKGEPGFCPECKTPAPRGKYICLECGADLRRSNEEIIAHPLIRPPRRMKGEYDEGDVRDIARVPGVGVKKAEQLCKMGYSSLWKVKNASEEMLAEVPGIGPEDAKKIRLAMNLIIVLPRIRSKDEVLDEERECKKCGLPTPMFSDKCIDCGAVFDSEDLGERLVEELDREGSNALIEFYGRNLTKRPSDSQLWYALGLSLKQAGRAYAAKKAIERAKKLDPNNPKYLRFEEKLGRRADEPPVNLEMVSPGHSRRVSTATKKPIPEKSISALHTVEPSEELPRTQVDRNLIEKSCTKCGVSIPGGSQLCMSCSEQGMKEDAPSTPGAKSLQELETLISSASKPIEPVAGPLFEEHAEKHREAQDVKVVDASREGKAAKVSVMVGRRPMLSGYGLVNGKGRVNGLINGNGFINGGTISEIPLPRGGVLGRYAAIVTVLVTLFLMVNTLIVYPIEPAKSIRIDGNMMDWQPVGQYHGATPTNNPDSNLTSYSIFLEGDTVFFMARVEGTLFGNTTGVDSFYLFLDTDSDNSTGYACGSIGADYMVSAEGYDGLVSQYGLRAFVGQDRLNWNNWVWRSGVSVAAHGSFIEGSIAASALSLPSKDSLLAKFVVDDQDGNAGESSLVVGLIYGALKVTQRDITSVLPTGMTGFLELTFEVAGPDITLDSDSMVIAHSPGTIIDMRPPTFTVSAGHPVTAQISIDASVLPTGDVVEASLASVNINTPVTVHGAAARAYVVNAPAGKRIDGLFGDWPSPYLDTAAWARDPSLNIEAYDASTSGDTAFFYLKTQAATLRGSFSPVAKSKQLSPPGPGGGGPPLPSQRVTGESIARAYIDTDTSNASGYRIAGTGAKYMLEAKGQFGVLHSINAYRWEGRWVLFQGNPRFAKNDKEAEMSLAIPSVSLVNWTYVLETSDWRGPGDETVLTGTRGGQGTRTRGGSIILMGSETLMHAYMTLSDPTIDGDWSASEWLKADNYSTGNLEIYTMRNGTHLFIAIRVLNDKTYNSGDYARIAFDTDNGDETGPDAWDKMFNATDPDGSTVNEDYNGTGTGWSASYGSPYQWSANGKVDTDSWNNVTYEFAIPFQEVWNTSDPTPGQLAGMAIHVHDANSTGFDYYWGSNNLNNPSTYGHVDIPEFEQVVAVMAVVPAIAIMIRRRGKINKQRGH